MRIFLGLTVLVLVVLTGMMYWSSVLVEEDVKALRREVRELRLTAVMERQVERPRPHLDEALPNLLVHDPFYEKTLPEKLGPDFRPHGTLQLGGIGKPHNLHPFSNLVHIVEQVARCRATVGRLTFGKYESFSPDLAIKVEERDGEYWVHLRDHVYWEPLKEEHFPSSVKLSPHFLEKHQVTAHDFKFAFDALMNPYVAEGESMRTYLGDIEEFRVIDDLTFAVRWRTNDGKVKYSAKRLTFALFPLPCWVYQYFADGSPIVDGDDFRTNSIWAQNFAEHWAKNVIVSCGPWIFDGMKDSTIQFRRNPHYHNPHAALAEKMVVTLRDSVEAMWQDFKAGKIDLFQLDLAPEKMNELEGFFASEAYQKQAPIEQIEYLQRGFSYLGWNQRNPLFQDKQVRRALSMAIDCDRIIALNLNGLGETTTGPLFPGDSGYNSSIEGYKYDPLEAKRLLAESGWFDGDGDGILDKEIDGRRVPFRFSLAYYVNSTRRRTISDYVATALQEIGIDCRPVGLDAADLCHALDGQEFEAVQMAWGLGTPPQDPKQIWHSSGAFEKGSSNHICFANERVDELIEELHYEYDLDKREKLYHEFHEIIHDESPYTFLWVSKAVLLYRDYLQNVFIPADEQDLIPGATMTEPVSEAFYLR